MKNEIIIITILVSSGLLISTGTQAQPYIDIVNARYFNSPQGSKSTELNYLNISTTLPLQFKNKKDALILSPFFEHRNGSFDIEEDQKRGKE